MASSTPEHGTIAQVLQGNGYSTYQLGKWHQTPDDEATDLGPFDRWPSGKGFDHNYGFLGGATDPIQTRSGGRQSTHQTRWKTFEYIAC